jgi:hypothetical protein
MRFGQSYNGGEAGHVARMGEMIIIYKVLEEILPERK